MGSHQVHVGVPASVRMLRRRCASAYRAGAGIDDALEVCRKLAEHGVASTIGYAAAGEDHPRSVADAHLAALERLSAEDVDCYVSVKLSMLGFDAALFSELEQSAARAGRRLHLDALAPETAEATWQLLELAPLTARVSTTLPGRWPRSTADVSRAAKLGVAVRVVKGQWADGVGGTSEPAAEGFLRVVDGLRGHAHPVGVATHDANLLAESLRRLTKAGTSCEAELFYGLPFRAPAIAARRAGVPIRIYVPYGAAGAPYSPADLVRNPAAAWWLVQDLWQGKNKTWRAIRRARTRP
jgi:hypothetical protein